MERMDTRARQLLENQSHRMGDWTVEELIAAKDGRTISVVLPAKDELGTVAKIVREAMELVPGLVDEVVVIDSYSTDGTADAARSAGAIVYRQETIVPGFMIPGKGGALWGSLMVATGDIFVFVDADLRPGTFTKEWVVGLCGPLLTTPDVQLVKASYSRSHGDRMGQGGRVTELLARPLLNGLYPALAGIAQPLGGEYAATRALLEQVPFPPDYGVEVGLLVDTFNLHGVSGIAQVELSPRAHSHQDLAPLGRMAAQIFRTIRTRTPGLQRFAHGAETLVQFPSDQGAFEPRVLDIGVQELPAMNTVPDYLERNNN